VKREPVVIQQEDVAWETWREEDIPERGRIFFKMMISADRTPSDALAMGIARISPGETLRTNRHEQAEVYFVLEGTGAIQVGSEARPIGAGTAVFIPGNVPHSCANTGTSDLRLSYVFAANSFDEVEYVFEESRD
jgi:mannose-6-phosphate isomerase-like protein (cupin superfamily)